MSSTVLHDHSSKLIETEHIKSISKQLFEDLSVSIGTQLCKLFNFQN